MTLGPFRVMIIDGDDQVDRDDREEADRVPAMQADDTILPVATDEPQLCHMRPTCTARSR